MFTKRQYQILTVLSGADTWLSGTMLEELIGVGKRTIQTEIRSINAELRQKKLSENTGIISNNRKGYLLSDPSNEIKALLLQDTDGLHGTDERLIHSRRLLAVLLFEKDFISIGDIADRLYFSKSTVNMNLTQVKRVIGRTKNARLIVSHQKGIRLDAPENITRILCMKSMLGDNRMPVDQPETRQILSLIEPLYKLVTDCFLRHSYIVSGDTCSDFAKYLSVSIVRSRLGFAEGYPSVRFPLSALAQELAAAIAAQLDYKASEAELLQLEGRLRELNLLKKEPVVDPPLRKKLMRFLSLLEEGTGLRLAPDEPWLSSMENHISRMMLRIESGRTNIGTYTAEISCRYPLELHLLRIYLKAALETEIPDAELGYMILYLAAALEKQRQKLRILVVSDESAAVLYHLSETLKEELNVYCREVNVLPRYVYENMAPEDIRKWDLLLTTEHDPLLAEAGFYYINPFIGEKQLRELQKHIVWQKEKEEKARKEDLRRRYLAKQYECHMDGRAGSCGELLAACGINLSGGNISTGSIGEHLMCVISHDQDSANSLRLLHLDPPLQRKGKQITAILYAHYGGEGDMDAFFHLVSEELLRLR